MYKTLKTSVRDRTILTTFTVALTKSSVISFFGTLGQFKYLAHTKPMSRNLTPMRNENNASLYL